jgi:transcriptional regulator with PAS, ATPase and Fis domain
MNQDRKIIIGIFASSVTFGERIKNSDANKDLKLFISSIGLSEAVPKAKDMENRGVEVIIGRRGTAHILRENLSIPVLSFPHRSIDVLTGLKKAKDFGDKILFPVFRQKIDIDILEEILKIKVIQGIYHNNKSLAEIIKKGMKTGCNVVVGGNLTQVIAEKIDMNFIGIDTSDEDIASTIESAKSVALSNREERAKKERYQSIIEASNDGIIAVDENEIITILNNSAKKILGIKSDVEGKPLRLFIPNTPLKEVIKTRSAIVDQLGIIKKKSYMSSHLPITLEDDMIGAVSIIQNISDVIRSENILRKSFSKGFIAKYNLEDLIYKSSAMENVTKMCRQFAKTDSSILVVGDTGTGKEIVANSIHNLSKRKNHPFVSVNCAALPEQLLESELFGYEEGSFTGSRKGGKPGLFELAHQGTIFLDEIDSAPLNVQVLLLRVIQEKEVRRIGGEESIPVDVRIVTAGRDLTDAMHSGAFREDLFFRLNVLRITIPKLNNRNEDIPFLLTHFIDHFSMVNSMEKIKLSKLQIEKLVKYKWPGNVRQLRNFSEKLILNYNLISNSDSFEYLYQELVEYSHITSAPEEVRPPVETSLKTRIKNQNYESEAKIIKDTLKNFRFNKTKTAKELNISRSTLWRKIKEYNLE